VSSIEKPPFYYAEESQQNQFKCVACGRIVDILGKFGYCSHCGTRTDLQKLEKTLDAIRVRINAPDARREDCVRDAVSAFDSFVGQYVRELVMHIPLTQARKNRLESTRFHNVNAVGDELENTFDIDIFAGVDAKDQKFAASMSLRRHVCEHNGGEVDQEYLDQSGYTSVRLKQALREDQEFAHRTVGVVMRLARNLHNGSTRSSRPMIGKSIVTRDPILANQLSSKPHPIAKLRALIELDWYCAVQGFRNVSPAFTRIPLPYKGGAQIGRGHGSLSRKNREGVLQAVGIGVVRFSQCLCVLKGAQFSHRHS
jgi:DNA-directed RNA polymerase subunit RPC12/RpoP